MRQVAMLRGINLGANRRIPMADLRRLLTDAGFENVKTYVQSGNIALSAPAKPAQLEGELAALIEERFGFAVPVVVRSRRQLQAVINHDPIPGAADEPKLYQVTFLTAKPPAAAVARLRGQARESERLEVAGREIYTFHPDGVAGSKLSVAIVGKDLGAGATSRNWTTVNRLLEMAAA
jgi:uncharacterized protein (DUF1697 family)